jgi:hypothetical protein
MKQTRRCVWVILMELVWLSPEQSSCNTRSRSGRDSTFSIRTPVSNHHLWRRALSTTTTCRVCSISSCHSLLHIRLVQRARTDTHPIKMSQNTHKLDTERQDKTPVAAPQILQDSTRNCTAIPVDSGRLSGAVVWLTARAPTMPSAPSQDKMARSTEYLHCLSSSSSATAASASSSWSSSPGASHSAGNAHGLAPRASRRWCAACFTSVKGSRASLPNSGISASTCGCSIPPTAAASSCVAEAPCTISASVCITDTRKALSEVSLATSSASLLSAVGVCSRSSAPPPPGIMAIARSSASAGGIASGCSRGPSVSSAIWQRGAQRAGRVESHSKLLAPSWKGSSNNIQITAR